MKQINIMHSIVQIYHLNLNIYLFSKNWRQLFKFHSQSCSEFLICSVCTIMYSFHTVSQKKKPVFTTISSNLLKIHQKAPFQALILRFSAAEGASSIFPITPLPSSHYSSTFKNKETPLICM